MSSFTLLFTVQQFFLQSHRVYGKAINDIGYIDCKVYWTVHIDNRGVILVQFHINIKLVKAIVRCCKIIQIKSTTVIVICFQPLVFFSNYLISATIAIVIANTLFSVLGTFVFVMKTNGTVCNDFIAWIFQRINFTLSLESSKLKMQMISTSS